MTEPPDTLTLEQRVDDWMESDYGPESIALTADLIRNLYGALKAAEAKVAELEQDLSDSDTVTLDLARRFKAAIEHPPGTVPCEITISAGVKTLIPVTMGGEYVVKDKASYEAERDRLTVAEARVAELEQNIKTFNTLALSERAGAEKQIDAVGAVLTDQADQLMRAVEHHRGQLEAAEADRQRLREALETIERAVMVFGCSLGDESAPLERTTDLFAAIKQARAALRAGQEP
jgi:hypothetical protein